MNVEELTWSLFVALARFDKPVVCRLSEVFAINYSLLVGGDRDVAELLSRDVLSHSSGFLCKHSEG